jgi:mannose-1-phosphate guanylyltransferase/mannose-6-phosphate isomerase
MLIPVIMAGGVGSRLWPASREAYPKQFLAFSGASDAAALSLFQQTLARLEGLPNLAPPIVVCNAGHRFLVAEQLRQLGIGAATIILEPVGRNTAPAVALAALAASRASPDAVLLVLAADHVIAEPAIFRSAVSEGAVAAAEGALVTFGVVPLRPETGYGYIRRGAPAGSAFRVECFVEKPDAVTAAEYLASGEYYWNSGMFMFRADVYLGELARFEPALLQACKQAWQGAERDLDFLRIPESLFAACPANSIDYAVMEKTTDAVVLPLAAGWSDLGAWSAVWEQGPSDAQGNVCHGDVLLHESTGSFVQAESRLVALVGMENAVVVETSDAVLVAHRDKVQQVKAIVALLAAQQRPESVLHKRVFRPWGSYEGLVEAPGFQVKHISVNSGAALSLQLHHHRSEHWIVVQGTATVSCGEQQFELLPNESTYIPALTKHRLENRTSAPLILIEVQCGSYLGEDDIVRFDDVYGRQAS